jgi:hypothetical protein
MSEQLSKKLQEVESQLEEIRNDIAKINSKSLGPHEGYIKDYSLNHINRMKFEVQNTVEFLSNDENLVEDVKVKRFLEDFFSTLSALTLAFELYYVLRVASRLAYTDANDLIALDRTMSGFYRSKDDCQKDFEKYIDEKDYISLRSKLSEMKDSYESLWNIWAK